MGTQILTLGSDAEADATFYIPPVWDGLLGWFFINDNRVKAARNLRGDRDPAKVMGSPLFDAVAGTFQGNQDYLQTDIVETEAMTIFSVIRSDDTRVDVAHMPMFYGTYRSPAANGGGDTFGVGLHLSQSALRAIGARGNSVEDDVVAVAQLGMADVTQWQLIRHEVEAGVGVNRIYNRTLGLSADSGAPLPRLRSTGKFRIGSGYHEYGGACQVPVWVPYNRILSPDECEETEADIREKMAERGIIV